MRCYLKNEKLFTDELEVSIGKEILCTYWDPPKKGIMRGRNGRYGAQDRVFHVEIDGSRINLFHESFLRVL